MLRGLKQRCDWFSSGVTAEKDSFILIPTRFTLKLTTSQNVRQA